MLWCSGFVGPLEIHIGGLDGPAPETHCRVRRNTSMSDSG